MTLQTDENSQRYDPRIDLLKELADPVRLRVIDHLGHVGPATVSELAAALRVTMPQLSNHLRRLREAGLVHVERTGRHAIYALAEALTGRGWIERGEGRAVRVTRAGERGLRELDIQW